MADEGSKLMVQVGNIIGNLVPGEAVQILKVQRLGSMYSLNYVGVNSKKTDSRVVSAQEMEQLEILTEEGSFNFKGDPEKFVLFAEAERIRSAYQFDPLFAINCSIVDPLPHQVEAVYKFLLPQPKIRFLLADDTGAGKTIMTGLLLKEMMMRSLVERVLIVTPGGLTKQWQEDEMGAKFNIPFTLVNRSAFSADPTIFQTCNRIVASIDFLCREDVLKVVSQTSWDLVVFDEAHKLSAYQYGQKIYKSKRYEAAYTLSRHCEHLLLLTATPHRGRQDTFKKLLQLLDEDIFATEDLANQRVKEFSQEGLNKFFIRRLKEDMKDWNGNPLYKDRFTKTVSYQLSDAEKQLYEAVTRYLTKHKEEASQTNNIHVSLALQVMQRRLVSSIFAIKNTLERRWHALQGIVDEFGNNPSVWNRKINFDEVDVDDIDQYDDLDDEDREAIDNILSDPKKFKLFTTGKTLDEIKKEAAEVKVLFDMANDLYQQHIEERKYEELKKLLSSQGVIDGEKLVIFTEHRDTLLYLEERLSNTGYNVCTIHGGMSMEDRRQAQADFMTPQKQILIATDAAGEGINLQFCRLLINWDIPWNPNRLEQRMGRIHRYGQTRDVLVFNMVADNTREGQVLKKLLLKLDIIRESLGDDRVYDVIQDVFKGISLEAIISSVFDGHASDLDAFISKDEKELQIDFKAKIDEQQKSISHSTVDYKEALDLKEESDEHRLQPIYIKLFFERAFKKMGGTYRECEQDIYEVTKFPEPLAHQLKKAYKINVKALDDLTFCFNKSVFLSMPPHTTPVCKLNYSNPGNPVFDALVDCVLEQYHNDMLKGTVLVSPEDTDAMFAFYVKSQIRDNRPSKGEDNIAGEQLAIVLHQSDGTFSVTSPAKFLDLLPPAEIAKEVEIPEAVNEDEVVEWSFENVTMPLFEGTKESVQKDADKRIEYLRTAFSQVIMDIDTEINDLQAKLLFDDSGKASDAIRTKIQHKEELKAKRQERIEEIQKMLQLAPKAPEVLGCAYVVPLTKMEYEQHFGMSRDDDVEQIGMKVAMEYERTQCRKPEDVSKQNLGYDIRSIAPDGTKRYIEVKGRADVGDVMLSDNEMNRLTQLGPRAWLYIVTDCKKEKPQLHSIQNPARISFTKLYKGVQYLAPLEAWAEAEMTKE